MELDIETLQQTGLNKNEAIVYKALILLGQATASNIIKQTGFHRNIVYDNLEKLTEKGLVSSAYHDKKRVFQPTKAQAIVEYAEEQLKASQEQLTRASAVAKHIQNNLGKQPTQMKTQVYQGTRAIRELLLNIVENKEYWAIGVSNASVEVLGETFWKNFIQRIKDNNVQERLLVQRDFTQTIPLSTPKKTEIRYLPAETKLNTETMIYENTVAIIVYTNPPVATVIEDKNAASSFRAYFEQLWQLGKEKK